MDKEEPPRARTLRNAAKRWSVPAVLHPASGRLVPMDDWAISAAVAAHSDGAPAAAHSAASSGHDDFLKNLTNRSRKWIGGVRGSGRPGTGSFRDADNAAAAAAGSPAAVPAAPPSLDNVPDSVLLRILMCVESPKDRASCALVSPRWFWLEKRSRRAVTHLDLSQPSRFLESLPLAFYPSVSSLSVNCSLYRCCCSADGLYDARELHVLELLHLKRILNQRPWEKLEFVDSHFLLEGLPKTGMGYGGGGFMGGGGGAAAGGAAGGGAVNLQSGSFSGGSASVTTPSVTTPAVSTPSVATPAGVNTPGGVTTPGFPGSEKSGSKFSREGSGSVKSSRGRAGGGGGPKIWDTMEEGEEGGGGGGGGGGGEKGGERGGGGGGGGLVHVGFFDRCGETLQSLVLEGGRNVTGIDGIAKEISIKLLTQELALCSSLRRLVVSQVVKGNPRLLERAFASLPLLTYLDLGNLKIETPGVAGPPLLGATDGMLREVARWCGGLEEVYVGPHATVVGVEAVATKCRKLRVLGDVTAACRDSMHVVNKWATNETLEEVGRSCPSLRSLLIRCNADITDAGLVAFAALNPSITHLNVFALSHCLTYISLMSAARHWLSLESLILPFCERDDRADFLDLVKVLATCCPDLKVFSIGLCAHRHFEALLELLRSCSGLQYVYLFESCQEGHEFTMADLRKAAAKEKRKPLICYAAGSNEGI
ncbi:hypothetical protein CLOP_g21395 [Closterium sp. NIES-67]|nr:hypothetical protein CLOP_g21395 [Closterium sp. NIES-67]